MNPIFTLLGKFLTDKVVEGLTKKFVTEALGPGGIEKARKSIMSHPQLSGWLNGPLGPLIRKGLTELAPDEFRPIMKGLLGSESLKDLKDLDELNKKLNDKSWWDKLVSGTKEMLEESLKALIDIQGDSNTVKFLGPAMIGIGALPGNGDALLNPTPGVKSISSSSNVKFRKVASAKFIKVSQSKDDFMPNYELDSNFKDNALKSYQKIISSDASDREKSIMLNYLLTNMQNQVTPALSYIKEYFPDIYSQYETKFK
jgi:hypothetical protein